IPTVIWSYPNNLLDATMALFDVWSVFYLIRAMKSSRMQSVLVYTTLGGVFLFAATLTKGPVGLYPRAVPLIYAFWISTNDGRNALGVSLGTAIILLTGYGLLYFWPGAWGRLDDYIDQPV